MTREFFGIGKGRSERGGFQLSKGLDAFSGPIDNGVKFPQTAAQWVELGVASPDLLYTFQEASGNIVEQITGTYNLVPNGTWAYQEALSSPFSRLALLGTEQSGKYMGVTLGSEFDITAGESFAVLIYVEMPTPTSLSRAIGGVDDRDVSCRIDTVGTPQLYIDDGVTSGADDTHDDSALHPFLCVINRATGFTGLYTDLESVEETTDPGAIVLSDTLTGVGDLGVLGQCGAHHYALMAVWHDVDFDETLLELLGWTLAY